MDDDDDDDNDNDNDNDNDCPATLPPSSVPSDPSRDPPEAICLASNTSDVLQRAAKRRKVWQVPISPPPRHARDGLTSQATSGMREKKGVLTERGHSNTSLSPITDSSAKSFAPQRDVSPVPSSTSHPHVMVAHGPKRESRWSLYLGSGDEGDELE